MKIIYYLLFILAFGFSANAAEYNTLWKHKFNKLYSDIQFSFDGKWAYSNNTVLKFQNNKLEEEVELEYIGVPSVFPNGSNSIIFVNFSKKKLFHYQCDTRTTDTIDVSFIEDIDYISASNISFLNTRYLILYTSSIDFRIYDLTEKKLHLNFYGEFSEYFDSFILTRDNKYLITRRNNTINKYDLAEKKYLNSIEISYPGSGLVYLANGIDGFTLVYYSNKLFVLNNENLSIEKEITDILFYNTTFQVNSNYPMLLSFNQHSLNKALFVNYLEGKVEQKSFENAVVSRNCMITNEDTVFIYSKSPYLIKYSFNENNQDTLQNLKGYQDTLQTMLEYEKRHIFEKKKIFINESKMFDIQKKLLLPKYQTDYLYFFYYYDEEHFYYLNTDTTIVIAEIDTYNIIDTVQIPETWRADLYFSYDKKYYISQGNLFKIGLLDTLKEGIDAVAFLPFSEKFYYCFKSTFFYDNSSAAARYNNKFSIYDINNEVPVFSYTYDSLPSNLKYYYTLTYNKSKNELIYFDLKDSNLVFVNLETKEEYKRKLDYFVSSITVSENYKYLMLTKAKRSNLSDFSIIFYDFNKFEKILEIEKPESNIGGINYSINFKYLILSSHKSLYCIETDLEASSIEDFLNMPSLLSVYPNPASQNININAESYINKIEIYSVSGGLLKVYDSISSNSARLELETLQTGAYLIKAYFDGFSYSKKFVKE